MRRRGHGASRSVEQNDAPNPSATMKAWATRPVSVKGNEIGEAVPVADEKTTTPRPSYCGAAQSLPFVWQGLAMMPPWVETQATTQPSALDTLRESLASNCRAENAIDAPQSNAEATAEK